MQNIEIYQTILFTMQTIRINIEFTLMDFVSKNSVNVDGNVNIIVHSVNSTVIL